MTMIATASGVEVARNATLLRSWWRGMLALPDGRPFTWRALDTLIAEKKRLYREGRISWRSR